MIKKVTNLLDFLFIVVCCLSFNVYAATEMSGVFFKDIADGQTVSSPFKVEMEVAGKKVGPAGEVLKGVGHHHIIIDGSFLKEGEVIPADQTHLHFGKAQTETELTLTPGKHTLTLQFADGAHRSYGEAWSKTITIEVKQSAD